MSMSPRERTGAWVLVLVTLMWGVSFPLVGDVVAERTVGQMLVFLALRFLVASLAFLPLYPRIFGAASGRGLVPWGYSLVLGSLLFGGFLLQTIGLKYTTPSRSAFITMLSVPMVPFLAAMWHRRRPSHVHVLGSLVATLGVAIILAPGGDLAPNLGDWLTLIASVFFAVEILALERATRRAPSITLAFGQIAGVGVLAGLALLFVPFEIPDPWPGLVRGVGITGIVCTTMALGAMTWGSARVRAEVAAVIFALEPIFAALFEWLLQGRAMTGLQWVGGIVVVLAVAVSSMLGGSESPESAYKGP